MLLCKVPEGIIQLLTILVIAYFIVLIGLVVGFFVSKKGSSARQTFGILSIVFWSITLILWLAFNS